MEVRSTAVAILGSVAAAALCASLVAVDSGGSAPTVSARSGTTPTSTSTTHPSTATTQTAAASTSSPIAELSAGGGWALTPTGLEITKNRGRTFSTVEPPIPTNEIRAVAINRTRVTVAGSSASQAGFADDEVSITASSDGGRTWSPAISVTSPPGTPADAVQLVSSGGSVVGMLITALSPPTSWGVWFSTTNHGATWTEEARVPSGGLVTDAGGALWLVSSPTSHELFRSADGGEQWTRVRLPTAITGAALDLAGTFPTGRVVLVADTPDPATGVPIDVLTTSDGGRTWKTLAHSFFTGGLGGNVPMTAAVVGHTMWIAGSGARPQLVESTGKVMDRAPPRRRATVQAVSAATPSTAWAIDVASSCPEGKTSCHDSWWLYRTSNAGLSWTPMHLAPANE